MLTGYVIFHRSVPIIRARLSQRDLPDVCNPFPIGLGIFSQALPPGLARTFQKHFLLWRGQDDTAPVGSAEEGEKCQMNESSSSACILWLERP